MIVQDLNFDQTVAMAKAKAESMIQNGLYSRFGLSEKERPFYAVSESLHSKNT